ncbi:MAG: 16S rRNA (guanine(527)-N(7))-methyltransferase RsmG [Candidatus Hydrogenedentota bacterium]|uniref:Ribosomal RNA small subunit methyltransferase G n=1 Tax=Sumerlaea chitinivorans TaxID=2250252 RepID=A0A2Z4Y5A7_SUMC1|nr:rRNA small subunit 7-methylguanosine (m7G) methyltransferase GidB [Candidatus Sumerlaea chitinivorans]MCX7964713.1 16S rRNA (guanine(527)-N(7))-methyltransferase RsmG [Candidatus Sumerlaea chitinivorans]RMH27880.1 MAG: 16S rRNA (guanine(527)-N(7))-methyltransferase RsmG [Candidatus Hydrogenedentota bacterium]GIX45696.1 MAG: ribosomal RNA small subunit methyltransferase G [Candidatus Sumerlaea sp.]
MNTLTEFESLIAAQTALAAYPPEVRQKLAVLLSFLLERNQQINLTAIREPEAIILYHYVDSLELAHAVPDFLTAKAAADIGSGAGFPVLPLALVAPACHWYAIESVGKKAAFIREAANLLELSNVTVVSKRAEDFAHGPQRGILDLVTARAVGCFAGLCEVGLPMLRQGGKLVLYKTASSHSEVARSAKALEILGGELVAEHSYRLTGDRQDRVLYVVERVKEVPAKYPRPAGEPFRKRLA